MVIIDYKKKYHKQIIAAAVKALKAGKAVAYPTDTSYGLAVDATSVKAIKKLYKIKGRNFNKPVHVVIPSIAYGKKIARWNPVASKLAKKFWPGALTLGFAGREGSRPFPTKIISENRLYRFPHTQKFDCFKSGKTSRPPDYRD